MRGPFFVSKKTQHAGYDQGVVESLILHVGLAQNRQWRIFLRMEQTLHRSESYLLVLRDHHALAIAGGIKLQTGRNCSDRDSDSQEQLSKFNVGILENVIRAH